jgi:hypothetical protein
MKGKVTASSWKELVACIKSTVLSKTQRDEITGLFLNTTGGVAPRCVADARKIKSQGHTPYFLISSMISFIRFTK